MSRIDPELLSRVEDITAKGLIFYKEYQIKHGSFFSLRLSFVGSKSLADVQKAVIEHLGSSKAQGTSPFIIVDEEKVEKVEPEEEEEVSEEEKKMVKQEVKKVKLEDDSVSGPPTSKRENDDEFTFTISVVAQVYTKGQRDRMIIRWLGKDPECETRTQRADYQIAFPPLDAASFAKGQIPQTNLVESFLYKVIGSTVPNRKHKEVAFTATYTVLTESEQVVLLTGTMGTAPTPSTTINTTITVAPEDGTAVRGKRDRSPGGKTSATAAATPTAPPRDAKIILGGTVDLSVAASGGAPPAGASKKQLVEAREAWVRKEKEKAAAEAKVPQRPDNAMTEDPGQRLVMDHMTEKLNTLRVFHERRKRREAEEEAEEQQQHVKMSGLSLCEKYFEGDAFFSKADSAAVKRQTQSGFAPTPTATATGASLPSPQPMVSSITSPLPITREKRYVPVLKVGEGTFGEVFVAKDLLHGTLVVIKQCRAPFHVETGLHNTIVRETQVSTYVRHPNLLRLLDYYVKPVDGGCCHMVFPVVTHDLPGVLRKWRTEMLERSNAEYHEKQELTNRPDGGPHRRNPPRHNVQAPMPKAPDGKKLAPDVPAVKCVFKQILEGLAALHDATIMHRDIKLSNILVREDGTVLMCDYGWSRLLGKDAARNTWPPCTLFYRPPELLVGIKYYTQEVDIWGLGCLLIELLCFQPLFPAQSELEALSLIAAALGPIPTDKRPYSDLDDLPLVGRVSAASTAPPGSSSSDLRRSDALSFLLSNKFGLGNIVDSTFMDFLLQMLCYEPSQRASARSLLQHSWFTGAVTNHGQGRGRFLKPLTLKELEHKLPKRNSYRFYDKAEEMGGNKHLWLN